MLCPAPAVAQGVTPPVLLDDPVAPWPGAPEPHDVLVPMIVTVRTDGSVAAVEITESAGAAYDAAAAERARTFHFRAADRDGTPVAARVRALVRFVAPAPPETPPPASLPAAAPSAPKSEPAPTPPAAPMAPVTAPVPAGADAPIEVVVEGRAPPPPHGASDFETPVGELARVPRKNASELLKLAPGVFLTNEGGAGHAERIYLRGFDAREGQDIEVTVDGVPVNESGNLHGNGFADLHFIIPELVLSLRVLEGPFDPRQGNYAVAGSAGYEMGLQQRGLTGKVTLGSYGTQRALVLWGPPGEDTHTYGGAEIAQTDGYGQNRDARHGGAMAQYEGRIGARTTFRVSGTAYADTYHSAGLLREDTVASGRKSFYDTEDPGQGGDGTRFQVATDIESKAGNFVLYQQLFAIRRGMRLRENFTGFLLDEQTAVQEPHTQRGDLFDMHVAESTLGGRGWARTHGSFLGHEQELEIGYFARADSVTATQQRIEAATGLPYKTETSLDSDLADIGLYADVALRPLGWLTLRGGARSDLFVYDVHDLCAVHDVSLPSPDHAPGDASCLDQQRGGAHREPDQRSSTASTKLMPRATLQFGPFSHFTLALAWGEGVRSIDPSYITQDVATPFASIVAEEAGVTYARTFDALSVVARSIFFRTHV
ncbi:MAG TPA: TonB-dependent receptor, partial [Polyangiaceae bacterium]|nr:TonB-dependent receptor [Polyangiaceae bacterium]